jgi:hypothetical protein
MRPDDPYIYENHFEFFVDLELMGAELDRIFEIFRDDMGFHSPHDVPGGNGRVNGNQIWDTYKGIFRLEFRADWNANGGTGANMCLSCGSNRTIQVFTQSVGSTRPFYDPAFGTVTAFPTIVHEMAHSFQGTNGQSFPNPPWHGEIHSQHSLLTVYPHWFWMEHHGSSVISSSHRGFRHANNIWSHAFVFEDWADTYGRDIIARKVRANAAFPAAPSPLPNPLPEHPQFRTTDEIASFRRYFDLTQSQMNDRMFESARRFVTWDLDSMREINAPFANIHDSGFTNDGGDWYRVAGGLVPNPYGYNAVRLHLPTTGDVVTVDFRGLDGAFPVAGNAHRAGWRYGFLAMTSDGVRHYGPIHAACLASPEGAASFTVPANTEYLWFVVMGAPTEHWNQAHGVNNENWGYEIRLHNTAFHMANVEIVYLNTVNVNALEDAIATAQARLAGNYPAEALEALKGALEAALLIGPSATQAEINTAASNLILAIFGLTNVDPVAEAARLSTPATVDAAGGNIARIEYGGDLRVSHIRHLFNSPVGHTMMAERLRDGQHTGAGTLNWNTERGFLDGITGPEWIPFPPNAPVAIPEFRWTEKDDAINTNPKDRHFITMTWDEPMLVDGTRIVWWYTTHLLAADRSAAFLGTLLPAADTFVEYWDGTQWVRITHMINDEGIGVGTLGNLGSGNTAANWGVNNNRWNGVTFEPVVTTALRINTAKAPFVGLNTGIGATQWEIFGQIAPPPPLPVPGFDIFNNGEGGSPSRPNPGLATSGIIRMWTQLDGVNTPFYLDAADTIVALDQDDNDVSNLLTIPRVWVAGEGFIDYFSRIDVDTNANWIYINFTITVLGQEVDVLLVNPTPPAPLPAPSFDIFNNGEGGSPSRPNPNMPNTIRMWAQLDGVNTPFYLAAADTIVALDQSGNCAVEANIIRVGRMWSPGGWIDYFNFIDVNKNLPWETIDFSITVNGQIIKLYLVNGLFVVGDEVEEVGELIEEGKEDALY